MPHGYHPLCHHRHRLIAMIAHLILQIACIAVLVRIILKMIIMINATDYIVKITKIRDFR